MTERATVLERVQIGVESTPGTAVAANHRLQAIELSPAIESEVSEQTQVGGKLATVVAKNKEWSTAKVGGAAEFEELTYLLASLITDPTSAQQASTTAYKHTFTLGDSAADSPKSLTVETGSAQRAQKQAFARCNELALKFGRDGVDLSGSMIAQRIADGITLTSSPDVRPQVPMLGEGTDVFLDTTYGGLGSTQLTRNFKAELSIGGRYGPVWPNLSSATSFAELVELEPKAELALTVAADSTGMGALTTFRAGSRIFVRIENTGPNIATTYYYKFRADLCLLITGMEPFEDADGVYAIGYKTRVASHDDGPGLKLELTNKLTDVA